MLLLAAPYPDEPISGALVRGCRHFGVPLKQLLSLGEAGERKANGAPFFGVSPLPFFAELFDVNPRALLAGHTVLPYATAFSVRDVWERAIASAIAGTVGNRAIGAVIQSAIHGLAYRRVCPACVAEDIRARGESYWRLSHQLPGCLVCPVHGEVLRATKLRIAGNGTSYDLPQDCSGRACIATPVPEVWRQIAKRIAELSCRGLEQPLVREGAHYRDLAVARGWLRPDRAVNVERLTKLFIEAIGRAQLSACGLLPSGQASWPALMLQASPGVPFTTLKHVLMELFLSGPPIDLSHRPSGPSARSRTDEDRSLAAAFGRVADRYAATGQRAKVSTLLQEAGCWGQYRHSRASLPRLRRVVEAFQTSERAHRPQARQMLAVPGQDRVVATRQDLIKAGHLLCSEDAAARLGIHWYGMKPLQRSGRILSVRYAGRDWYPAFWFDGRIELSTLEAALASVASRPVSEQWAAMVDLWSAGSTSASSASPGSCEATNGPF